MSTEDMKLMLKLMAKVVDIGEKIKKKQEQENHSQEIIDKIDFFDKIHRQMAEWAFGEEIELENPDIKNLWKKKHPDFEELFLPDGLHPATNLGLMFHQVLPLWIKHRKS
jgi:hypothetical protein